MGLTRGGSAAKITCRTPEWLSQEQQENLEVSTKVVGEVLEIGEVAQEGRVG